MFSATDDFNAFWSAYPRKVGKFDAKKAYAKARVIATADEILAGVETYKRCKPDYADWCHPATWLNKGRWLDEYDEDAPKMKRSCPHDPPCASPVWCDVLTARARGEIA